MTHTLQDVAKFLLGEGPLDGVWYSDPHPTERGAFWWRKHLRAALAQQGEPVAVIEGTRMWINGVEGSTVRVLRPGEWPEKGTFLYAGAAPAAQPLVGIMTGPCGQCGSSEQPCYCSVNTGAPEKLKALLTDPAPAAQQGEQQPAKDVSATAERLGFRWSDIRGVWTVEHHQLLAFARELTAAPAAQQGADK